MNTQNREIEDITSHSIDGTKKKRSMTELWPCAIISYAKHLPNNSCKQDHPESSIILSDFQTP